MQIIIDLDGTIFTEEKTFSRSLAQPLPGAVDNVNALYNQGHTIILYSSRSWQEYEMTVHWLKHFGIKYHQLYMGKPIGDVWIDDRAIPFNGWEEVKRSLDARRTKI